MGKLKINILIAIGAAMLLIPFLGVVHLFDWDEINFAECAREMIVSKNYFNVTINYQAFWEKPPLFIWLSAACMNLFGVNEFAARLPNALCGIATLVVLFNIGSKIQDKKLGILWVLCYAGSLLPQFYFKSGIIDPWFNLFIFLGIYYFILFSNFTSSTPSENKNIKQLSLSALFIGLAVLTKGPVALLIGGLCFFIFYALQRFRNFISLKNIFLYTAVVITIGGLWFLILALNGHMHIMNEFFTYQIRLFKTEDSGHGGPFFYHFVVLFIGCFPASTFAIASMLQKQEHTPFQAFFMRWMKLLFWVVLILFSFVNTKIVHYSYLCYFPLTYLAAQGIYGLMSGKIIWKKWMGYSLLLSGGLIGIALAALPLVDFNKEKIIASGIIKDNFAVENLKANVHWSGWEALIGLGLITIIILFLLYKNSEKKYIFLLTGSLIITHLSSIIIAPRIEQYSQGAAIAFYQSLQNKDCYVETLGFKSYAQYYYAATQSATLTTGELLNDSITKETYFVSKIIDAEKNKNEYQQLEEMYRKNGFIFYKRAN